MNVMAIKQLLKNGLGIGKEIVALKQVKENPLQLEAYGEKNNICYMMGEVLEEGNTARQADHYA